MDTSFDLDFNPAGGEKNTAVFFFHEPILEGCEEDTAASLLLISRTLQAARYLALQMNRHSSKNTSFLL